MQKISLGLLVGILAGIIDVIPMIIQKLPLAADLSAFVMWLAVGVLVTTSNLKLPGALKGIVIAFLVLAPTAVLIGRENPFNLIPVVVMTMILGAGAGQAIEYLSKKFIKTSSGRVYC